MMDILTSLKSMWDWVCGLFCDKNREKIIESKDKGHNKRFSHADLEQKEGEGAQRQEVTQTEGDNSPVIKPTTIFKDCTFYGVGMEGNFPLSPPQSERTNLIGSAPTEKGELIGSIEADEIEAQKRLNIFRASIRKPQDLV